MENYVTFALIKMQSSDSIKMMIESIYKKKMNSKQNIINYNGIIKVL